MTQEAYTPAQLQQAVDSVHQHGSVAAAGRMLNVPESTLLKRHRRARQQGYIPQGAAKDDPVVLKAKITKLEGELARATRENAEISIIKDVIGSLGEQISVLKLPAWTCAPLKKASSPGVPTLFLSDFHHGETVYKSQIGGVNEFNIKISHERLAYTVETAIHLLRILDKQLDYPGIVVPLGGDMISGNIHDELTATNELNTMPTVLDLYGELVGAITRLADVFGAVFVPCVSGNHGRDTRKIWIKDRHATSFDWLIYQFLAKHFADDKRVTFYVPDASDAPFKIFDVRFLLTHGDQFRGGDSIIGPLGPLTRGDQKKRARNAAVDMNYDVMMHGHFHQYSHGTRIIGNGSLKGYDEFAFFNNFGFEKPAQSLFLTHKRHGITYRMPVYCEPGDPKITTDWISIPSVKKT
jgi:transposase-like protein